MVSKIFHITDVHCRNLKRHAEYKTVFDRMFGMIAQMMDEDSIIVLTGDLAHSKTEMSPELIDLLSYLLTRCSELCETFVIPGNHDCNLNNPSRQDALSPIIASLGLPRLHYSKHSEVFEYDGITFSHFSILDDPDTWVKADQLQGDYKVALYHGPVVDASTDIGFKISTGKVTVQDFDGFDIALLGDIHKRQQLQKYNKKAKKAAVEYPGSLIQQNHSEDLDKGFLVWDVVKRASKYVSVPNDHGYFTIVAVDNQVLTEIPKHLKQATLRVKHENCDRVFLQQLQAKYKTKYGLSEVPMQAQRKLPAGHTSHSLESLCNVRDTQRQKELILEFIHNLPADQTGGIAVERLLEINEEVNAALKRQKPLVRGVIWKPLQFSFSNMFSYGEGNSIDFSDYTGVYGVFAPNASGKSTLLDALMYCIFDKCSRTSRAAHVLNNTSTKFSCELHLELDSQLYRIRREGNKGSTGHVRVTVNFHKFQDGEWVCLNGDDREGTNRAIREVLGEYDDFVITSLSTQIDNQSFIDRTQKDRKELLYKFLDIDVFEDFSRIAKESHKEFQSQAKYLEGKDLNSKLQELNGQLVQEEVTKDETKRTLQQCQQALDEVSVEIDRVASTIKPLQVVGDPEAVAKSIAHAEAKFTQITEEARKWVARKEQLEAAGGLDTDWEALIKQDKAQEREVQSTLMHLSLTLSEIEKHIHGHELERKRCVKDVETLEKHEYDPACKYCVSNPLIAQGQSAERQITVIDAQLSELSSQQQRASERKAALEAELSQIQSQLTQHETQKGAQRDYANVTDRLSSLRELALNAKSQIKAGYEQLEACKANEEAIAFNREVEANLSKLKQVRQRQETKLSEISAELTIVERRIGALTQSIDQTKAALLELHELNLKTQAYALYLQAVSRDGIPLTILNQVLPLIEYEVNEILSQVVDFTITLECSDANAIVAYINYGPDKVWPVELASGMERFMLSLAIRSALVNITTLPRPNFLAIDEGFGVLDSDKVASVYTLFDHLKTQYTFLICISHLDVMRDLTDKHITIVKENGTSKIAA